MTARDAKLDRLLDEYASIWLDVGRHPGDGVADDHRIAARKAVRAAIHAIHAHVEAEKEKARGEVLGTGSLYDSHVGSLRETHPYPRDQFIPVLLVRREEARDG